MSIVAIAGLIPAAFLLVAFVIGWEQLRALQVQADMDEQAQQVAAFGTCTDAACDLCRDDDDDWLPGLPWLSPGLEP